RPGLGDIPKSCVACVFLYLTSSKICNLALFNLAFRSAASSDSVWEAKLPRNYQELLDLVLPERHRNLSKKDIFALLSRPLPFDDGHKVGGALQVRVLQEVWLDRVTGRVCMLISAWAMAITGMDECLQFSRLFLDWSFQCPRRRTHVNVEDPASCIILIGLFALQHYGTHRVGFLFAPEQKPCLLILGTLANYQS
ncbi:hypothetical protein V8G54_034341, partial [Vigna mungo]